MSNTDLSSISEVENGSCHLSEKEIKFEKHRAVLLAKIQKPILLHLPVLKLS